ncbi:hypothetical protein [Ruminococcus flavefaciens]|uniref:hypothetical protein n=1 Tax=Ruminococcus flavefaciens TaxID=1265 RepID=UPI0026F1097D|nr:hypothetical protein [Ruminococcus flavefaciens]
MQWKDYKDALNDIRLSSEFCKEMEAKLSEEPDTYDEYEEVENHVEVIHNKDFRKYLAAAAVVAVIGAVGSGGYMRIKSDLNSGEQYGLEDEAAEKTAAEDNNPEKIFSFPFGDISLKNTTFLYSSYSSLNGTLSSSVANDETSDQLIELFSQIDWAPVSEADLLCTAINTALSYNTPDVGVEAIAMTYYNEGTEINISFRSNGFIMVSCTSPEPRFTDSYYNMTVEQFNQLKKILFDAQKIGVATLPGFEIDFNGISYSAFGKTGTVNEMQANALALAITNQELTLMPEDTEAPDDEPISFIFSSGTLSGRIDCYPNGVTFIERNYSDSGEHFKKAYACTESCYSAIEKLLVNKPDDSITVDISEMSDAMVKYTENGSCTAFIIDEDELANLQECLENIKWYSEYFSFDIHNYEDVDCIYIGDDKKSLKIYSNGNVVYYDINSEKYSYYYVIEDYNTILSEIKSISGKTLFTDSEIVRNTVFQHSNYEETSIITGGVENSPIDSMRLVSSADLNKLFENIEWEHIGYIHSNISSSKIYYAPRGASNFLLNDNGIFCDLDTGICYKCSDPEALIEGIEALHNIWGDR